MANYQLGVFVDGAPQRFESYGLLSQAQYEQYRQADSLVRGFLSDYQQFEEVRSSYS